MKSKAIYDTITANLNTDGSPNIIAWRGKTYDRIPLSDGKGGTIARVVPADALHLAAPDLLNMLQRMVDESTQGQPCPLTMEHARAAIAKATE